MEKVDFDYFQKKLTAEKNTLEEGLKEIGRVNPKNSKDWEAKSADTEEISFNDEVADRLEELEEREAEITPLEIRLRNVDMALAEITAGTYGICHICQKPIERERLEVNAAAHTCKQHLAQKPVR